MSIKRLNSPHLVAAISIYMTRSSPQTLSAEYTSEIITHEI